MWFTVYRAGDLSNNERMIQFYKKELQLSHIINIAKEQKHYGTRWYRKTVSYDFPSARRYIRLRALVKNAYKKNNAKYNMMIQLGKVA